MEKTAITSLLHQLAEGDAALEVLLAQALTRALGKQGTAPDRDKLRHIRDWLKAAQASGDTWLNQKDARGVPVKLAQIGSIDRAYAMADKDMKRKNNTLRSQFAGVAAHFEADEAAGHIKTVHVFDDGSRMVQLLTPHALDVESVQLGHCIGHGGYDDMLESGWHVYYSYRDPLNRAHATLEVKDGILEQCRGKENAPPVERYFKPIQDFIRFNKWNLTEEVTHTALLEKDGAYYNVVNLPDGFVWDRSLYLRRAEWLKKLPKNLDVRGKLVLDNCKRLKALPENLKVGLSLHLEDCTELKHLPKQMEVKGFIYWDNKMFRSVAAFRAAFEAILPPQNENRVVRRPVPKVA